MVRCKKRINEAGAADLKGFLDSRPNWRAGCTLCGKIIAIRRALNWALGERLTRENPFRGMRPPKKATSAADDRRAMAADFAARARPICAGTCYSCT